MKKFVQFRQGDVLLEKIEALPVDAWESADKLLIAGESTNHGHYATGESEVFTKEGELFVKVTGKAALEHLKTDSLEFTGEHKKIDLPKGVYRVIWQREYDPFQEWEDTQMGGYHFIAD